MELEQTDLNCQVPSLQQIAEGPGEVPPESFSRRVKLAIRRRLNPTKERTLKKHTNNLMNRFRKATGKSTKPASPPQKNPPLQTGDVVRVRSMEEIKSTLDNWGLLKGCGFMPEMAEYCGTTQRVHKRMERFVDERDLRVKKCRGIILLDGVECHGTAQFGTCDRSCLFFWREEWLEKIG
jgi:hypothetical protein